MIRKPYGGKRHRVQLETGNESMTQQNFKDECDINNILKKYKRTGLVEHVASHGGRYEDLSQPVDYQTALNVVISAQAAFDSLPSDIRKQFGNNPQEFLEFVNNPDNQAKMADLGLIPQEEPLQPPVAAVPLETPPPPGEGEV